MYIFSIFIQNFLLHSSFAEVQPKYVLKSVKDDFSSYEITMNEHQLLNLLESSELRPQKSMRLFTEILTSAKPYETTEFDNYIEHVKEKGANVIKFMGRQILCDSPDEYVNRKIDEAINNYSLKVRNMLYFATPAKIVHDKEFVYLNTVEMASKHMYNTLRKFVTDTIEMASHNNKQRVKKELDTNNDIIYRIHGLEETIYRLSKDIKREEMKYICDKYKVCGPIHELIETNETL